jgi:hypothetical protein
MNNINNMNINIFNQIPSNPQKNLNLIMNSNAVVENQDLLENFSRLNVGNESYNLNNPSKKAIAYNYYFGGGGNNLEMEREQRFRYGNTSGYDQQINTYQNSISHQYNVPSMPALQNTNSSFKNYNTYNNNIPTTVNNVHSNFNDKTSNSFVKSNKNRNQFGKNNEIIKTNKNYADFIYDGSSQVGKDIKGKFTI